MLVIPAIDLKDGNCVRLKQGRMEDATIYDKNPLTVAERWVSAGCKRLHIVDLDGAFQGRPINAPIVEQIHQAFPDLFIQIGGGIRNAMTLATYFEAGASACILGTSSVKDPDFFRSSCQQFANKIILGVDAKDGMVAIEGWAEVSSLTALELIQRFADCKVESVVFTDIAQDGMLTGVNVPSTVELAKQSPFPVIASGGVKDIEDIHQLKNQFNIMGVIAGKALYTGALDLTQALKVSESTT